MQDRSRSNLTWLRVLFFGAILAVVLVAGTFLPSMVGKNVPGLTPASAMAAPPSGAIGNYFTTSVIEPPANLCVGTFDDFDNPSTPSVTVEVKGGTPTASDTQTGLGVGTLGGSRAIILTLQDGTSSVVAEVSVDGAMAVSANTGTSANTEVCYDANGQGLNVDLSDVPALLFDFVSSDLSCETGGNLTLSITDNADSEQSLAQNLLGQACPSGTPFQVPFLLGDFTSVDLNSIKKICWEMEAIPSLDYAVDDILCELPDYGDAPDTGPGTGPDNYNTVAGDNAPSHVIVEGLQLGVNAPDGDPGTLQNPAADADDTDPGAPFVDDEDGIATLPTITTASTMVTLGVSTLNDTNADATLACWIDFNMDGEFENTEEQQVTTVGAGTGLQGVDLVFTPSPPLPSGDTYIRCRIAYADDPQHEESTGGAQSGEVEDYRVTIDALDFGDLPDSFDTKIVDDGPSHVISDALYLGLCVDGEINGQPDAHAGADGLTFGDDGNGYQDGTPKAGTCSTFTNDEDGVTLVTPLIPGNEACVEIDAVNNGAVATLYGWIDFNGDGDFNDDANEFVTFTSGSVVNGVTANQKACFAVPADATFEGGETHMRFRLTTEALTATDWGGAAPDGEVEDYWTQLACVGNLVWNDLDKDGIQNDGLASAQDGVTVNMVWAGSNDVIDTPTGDSTPTGDDQVYASITDGTGLYQFCGVTLGWYQLKVITPPGVLEYASTPNASGSDFTDSDGLQSGANAPSVIPTFEIDDITGLPESEDGMNDGSPIAGYPDVQEDRSYDFGFTTEGGLSVSLGYVNSERGDDGMTHFMWETATESGVAGFNLYMEVDGQQSLVNPEMIPSSAIDSVVPVDYAYEAHVAGDRFYIELVHIVGENDLYGPFALGETFGSSSASPQMPGMMGFPLFLPTISGR